MCCLLSFARILALLWNFSSRHLRREKLILMLLFGLNSSFFILLPFKYYIIQYLYLFKVHLL